MVRLLALIVFIPIGAREISKRYIPRLIEWGEKVQYPFSLGLIACTMLGVFGKYSAFFFREPRQIFIAIALAFLLAALYMAIGSILLRGRSREDQLAGGISMAFSNKMLTWEDRIKAVFSACDVKRSVIISLLK